MEWAWFSRLLRVDIRLYMFCAGDIVIISFDSLSLSLLLSSFISFVWFDAACACACALFLLMICSLSQRFVL